MNQYAPTGPDGLARSSDFGQYVVSQNGVYWQSDVKAYLGSALGVLRFRQGN